MKQFPLFFLLSCERVAFSAKSDGFGSKIENPAQNHKIYTTTYVAFKRESPITVRGEVCSWGGLWGSVSHF